MPERRLKATVVADTTQAEKQVNEMKKKAEKPITTPITADLSGIEGSLKLLSDKMIAISKAFNKDVDFSKMQKAVIDVEKHINSMMTQLENGKKALNVNQVGFDEVKEDISAIKEGMKSIGNISSDLSSLEKMESLLENIKRVLEDIKTGFHFDQILPTTVIQENIDQLKKGEKEINDIGKQYQNIVTKLTNSFQKGTASRVLGDSFIDSQDLGRTQNMIALMQQYVELGGKLEDISFTNPALKGVTRTYRDVYDRLQNIKYEDIEGNFKNFNLPFIDNAEITGSLKRINEYNTEMASLNRQLSDAKAKESQGVIANFGDDSLAKFQTAIQNAIKSIGTLRIEAEKIRPVESQDFEQHPIEIEVKPKVSNPEEFTSEIASQLKGHPVEVEVKPVKTVDEETQNNTNFKKNNIDLNIDSNIQNEIASLTSLKEKVDSIIDAVKLKTEAFENESSVVNSGIEKELVSLNGLLEVLSKVTVELKNLSTSLSSGNVNNKENKNTASITQLQEVLNKLDVSKLSSLEHQLYAFDNTNAANSIQSIANALLNLKAALNNTGMRGSTWVSEIKEIISQQEALANLSNILNRLDIKSTTINKPGETRSAKTKETNASLYNEAKKVLQPSLKELEDNLGFGKITKTEVNTNGTAVVTFINKIGDAAETTIVQIKDLKAALNSLQNKTFIDNFSDFSVIKKNFKESTSKSNTQSTTNPEQIIKQQKRLYEIAQQRLKPSLQNIEEQLGLGKLIKTNFNADGTASVTFLKEIGTTAETTVIKINDLKSALISLHKGTFSDVFADFSSITTSTKESPTKTESLNTKRQQELFNVLNAQIRAYTAKGTGNNQATINADDVQTIERYNAAMKGAISVSQAYAETIQSKKSINNVLKDGLKDEIKNVRDSYVNQLNNTISNFDRIINTGTKVPEFSNTVDSLRAKVAELSNLEFRIDSDDDIKKLQELLSLIEQIKAELSSVKFDFASDASITKLEQRINDFAAKNERAMSDSTLRASYENILNSFNSNKGRGYFSKGEIGELEAGMNSLNAATVKAGKTGASLFSEWQSRMKNLGLYLASFASFYDIINMFREGVQTIRDLDTAFVEMQKVSNESLSTLKEFQNLSFDLGDDVGTTGEQIMQSTADWMRLGESLQEAQESAQTSNVLLNVSEFENIDEATKSLTSVSQAYKDLDKTDIVDKLNNIGNNFSISTDGLASALQRSASALVTAGNDIDEANALITAGNQVAQDPESVGAGMRTIALRIQGTEEAKAELEELGEDTEDYVVQTSSKIDESVRNFTATASNNFEGISILDENGNYRSTYEILQDIADIYDEIVETDQKFGTNHMAGLLELLAGKNRANIAASILQNGDILRSAYEMSQNSEGSAQEELDKYLNSVEGKITQLTNNLQELAFNTINTDLFKGLIDGGNTFLNVLNQILDNLGMLPILLSGGGIAAFIKNLDKPEIKGFVY